jgi:hypothetical protein
VNNDNAVVGTAGIGQSPQVAETPASLVRAVDDDPMIMAEHLSSLLTGGPLLRVILGLGGSPGGKNRRHRIDAAVKVFLRAYSSGKMR